MNVAAVVLFNNKNTLSAVDYLPVTDALLAGGIELSELVLVPYDALETLSSTLTRLKERCGAVLIICSAVLLSYARSAAETLAGAAFSDSCVLESECLFCVLTADMGGVENVGREVIPAIDRRRGQSFWRVVIKTAGAPAELLRTALERVREACPTLTVYTFERYADARTEIIYNRDTPKYTVDEGVRILSETLAEYLYATKDISLAARLVEALKVREKKISVAESFTGGGVGRAIVRVPGASAVYFEGINAYNAESKMKRLGVTPFTVEHRGTVSDETAYEMAAGLLMEGKCDLAVSTTGVAGPDPDEKGNPVGLCYFGVGTREQVNLYRYHLTGDRETITETAINLALFLAYRSLK